MKPDDSARQVMRLPDVRGLAAAVEAIESGQPVVIPTDTVYGLAVRAGDSEAVDHIFKLKRRPIERAIAVLVADVDQVTEFAYLNRYERRIAKQCWPGALTLVLNRLPTVGASLGRGDGTVGVRCPDHPFVRMLALAVGPLATTSANLSGEPTPVEATAAATLLDGPVAVVIDGGPCDGQASTVARVDRDGDVKVLREGFYTQRQLEQLARRHR
jgi:L-threonylcarbamoyladenylate synthase